jgi:hypothetical protein
MFEDPDSVFNRIQSSKLGPAVELLISKEDGVNRDITMEELGHARVVRFDSCTKCEFVLPKDVGALVKVFIETCEEFKVIIECKIVTRHVEISRCQKLDVRLKSRVDTLQIDLSKDVRVLCDKDSIRRVYHAGVQQLQICSEDTETCIMHDFNVPGNPVITLLDDETGPKQPSPEDQFVTRIVGNELKTERVVYKNNSLVPSLKKEDEMCDINDELPLTELE